MKFESILAERDSEKHGKGIYRSLLFGNLTWSSVITNRWLSIMLLPKQVHAVQIRPVFITVAGSFALMANLGALGRC